MKQLRVVMGHRCSGGAAQRAHNGGRCVAANAGGLRAACDGGWARGGGIGDQQVAAPA